MTHNARASRSERLSAPATMCRWVALATVSYLGSYQGARARPIDGSGVGPRRELTAISMTATVCDRFVARIRAPNADRAGIR